MKKILSILFLNILLLFSFGIPVFNMGVDFVKASAEETTPDPYTSDVMQDLYAVDDFKTKFENGYYLSNSSLDSFDVIHTLEWGAGDCIDNKRTYYYVYLYVWNRSGLGFSEYNFEKARISTYFENLGKYDHVNLTYCSKSADNKFIKYRFKAEDKTYFSDTTNHIRHYPVYEMEIGRFNSNNVSFYKSYSICHEWIYSGTGGNTVVTYHSECEHLELEIHGGTYMTESSSESNSAKNVLYYAWFNVPTKFQGESYSLYSVHADYYRFDFSNKIGALIDEHDTAYYQDKLSLASQYQAFDPSLNASSGHYIAHTVFDGLVSDYNKKPNTTQPYAFWWTNTYGSPEFVGSGNHGTLEYTTLKNNYFFPIPSYNQTFKGSAIAEAFDAETAELLTGTNKQSVYKNVHYTNDAEPLNDAEFRQWNLLSYGEHHSSWEWFWSGLFSGNWPNNEVDITNIECIKEVPYFDIDEEDEDFASCYLIDSEDVSGVKSSLESAHSNGQATYLFRFDTSIYDSQTIGYYWANFDDFDARYMGGRVGYMATSYIGIVDFDVIDLTFVNKAQKLLQLPVVADPVNIFPTLVSPPEATWTNYTDIPLWYKLLAIIRILLIIILAIVLLWLILKIIGWVRRAFSKD